MKPNTQQDAPQHAATLELEHFLPYRLSVLSNRISNDIAERYRQRFGLNITEWRVIAVLGRFPGLSANEVSERTAMDKVAISRTVARLLDAGHVQRSIDPSDRRRSALQLSASGQSIFEQVAPLALAYEQAQLAGFSPEERTQLGRLLDRLARGHAAAADLI